MSDTTCEQVGCEEPGAYRYTWPGKDEALVCEKDVAKILQVADVLGMHLQVIPVTKATA